MSYTDSDSALLDIIGLWCIDLQRVANVLAPIIFALRYYRYLCQASYSFVCRECFTVPLRRECFTVPVCRECYRERDSFVCQERFIGQSFWAADLMYSLSVAIHGIVLHVCEEDIISVECR